MSIRFIILLSEFLVFGIAEAQPGIIASPDLRLESTIRIPAVAGRIDHMDMDLSTARVFLAALANNSVEVIDLNERKWLRSLTGFSEPQGVLCLPQAERLYVTNGGTGTCSVLDLGSLQMMKEITGLEDADNIRYDPFQDQIYVGYGTGGLAIVDPKENSVVSRFLFTGHPESFQIEKNGRMIYANVPTNRKIAVFSAKTGKTAAEWEVSAAANNFPMALDESRKTLFVGCRTPPRLLVFSTASAAVQGELPIGRDVDDIFVDVDRRSLYVSCGEGVLLVLTRDQSGHYKEIQRVETRRGARTSLFVPSLSLLLVAAPATGNAAAELLVYSVHCP